MSEEVFDRSLKTVRSPPRLPLTENTAGTIRRIASETDALPLGNSHRIERSSLTSQKQDKVAKPGQNAQKPIENLLNKQIDQFVQKESTVEAPRPIIIKIEPKSPEITTMAVNAEEINRKIISFIPEFNGQDDNVSKFLHCSEWVRKSLNRDEQKIFDQLITYRLAGDAYRKIEKRNITDFETLKLTLNSIYTKTISLDEIHRQCFTCTQNFNETTRQYGYRIRELLDDYISGYTSKYQATPDRTHTSLLNEKAVQTFKNGLNNTILKDKISTIRAKTIDNIIEETEITENMLKACNQTAPIYTTYNSPHTTQQSEEVCLQPNKVPIIPIICQYCGKQNHLWKDCRTRLQQEKITTIQSGKYQMQNYRNNNVAKPTYPVKTNNPPKYCLYCKIYGHDITECRNRQRNEVRFNNTIPEPSRNNPPPFTKPNYPAQWTQNRPTNNFQQPRYPESPPRRNMTGNYKFCQYCKRIGHEITECRAKTNDNQTSAKYNQPLPTKLEDQFSNMRICKVDNIEEPEYSTIQHPENY